MQIRIPRRSIPKWLRVKERISADLRKSGIDPKDAEIHAAVVDLADVALGHPGLESQPRRDPSPDELIESMRQAMDLAGRLDAMLRAKYPAFVKAAEAEPELADMELAE